jgi:hypothetical protein
MTDDLTFGEVPHDDGKGMREWVLRGPAGAVNFLMHETGMGLVIGWHTPPGPGDLDVVPCELLPGGFCGGGLTWRPAGELGERLAGVRDQQTREQVIQGELAYWYDTRIGEPSCLTGDQPVSPR